MSKIINSALALALTSVIAACGGGSGAADGSSEGTELAGESFALGTKGFTEHFILTEMTRLLLENAGAKVTIRDLPSTQQVRQALEGGDLDMYWEYTGTGWTNFLGHEEAGDLNPEELHARVAQEDLEHNNVMWLPPAIFSNTYGIAVRSSLTEELGLRTMSDLPRLADSSPQRLTLCVDESFGDRPDGLPAVEETYGFDWPQRLLTVSDYALVFTSVDTGDPCNFGAIYTTDGRIAAQELTVLGDDKDAFLSYLPAITMMKDRYDQVGDQVSEIIAPLLKLDQDTITKLNA
ncbi:MAG: glycine/betaine ABC transporter substrate-binding protein, partial [Solirubrobacterales bacterium]|nr:glycine/betaine ABC transporter substrate-binding protein [Solirubrobacterales bacterium]